MKQESARPMTGLVLPGGGARGAFQVGVLKAIAEILPRRCCNPFPIISGTSAGAINATVLASNARRFRRAVAELDYVWSNFHSSQVYRSDAWTMFRSSMRWMAALVTGGNFVGVPRSLLNNAPLRDLLRRSIRFPRIQQNIDDGFLDALAITAASYGSARSATFFQGRENLKPWGRTRRIGIAKEISLDHLMASAAVPIIFPPVSVEGEFFGDGAMRQATPLSPAVHLGADRILVLSLRDETGDAERAAKEPAVEPSLAQIAGYMLDTLFMDGLYADLERITRVNLLLDAVPEDHRVGPLAKLRPIDTMIVVPSKDLRDIAVEYKEELSFHVRMLLRGVAGRRAGEQRLLSFLLFEQAYTRELIQLGYRDAMAIRDELHAFVTGAPVPRLSAPSWVSSDLLSLDGG